MSMCVCVCVCVCPKKPTRVGGMESPPLPLLLCMPCVYYTVSAILPALTLKPSDSVHFDHVCVVTLYVCVTQSYSYPVCPTHRPSDSVHLHHVCVINVCVCVIKVYLFYNNSYFTKL